MKTCRAIKPRSRAGTKFFDEIHRQFATVPSHPAVVTSCPFRQRMKGSNGYKKVSKKNPLALFIRWPACSSSLDFGYGVSELALKSVFQFLFQSFPGKRRVCLFWASCCQRGKSERKSPRMIFDRIGLVFTDHWEDKDVYELPC
jgi:hypothetical protein